MKSRDFRFVLSGEYFKNFLRDMGVRPANTTIDRINNRKLRTFELSLGES